MMELTPITIQTHYNIINYVPYAVIPWIICFLTGSRYLLISFTYFAYPATLFLSGSHQFVLCICESVSGVSLLLSSILSPASRPIHLFLLLPWNTLLFPLQPVKIYLFCRSYFTGDLGWWLETQALKTMYQVQNPDSTTYYLCNFCPSKSQFPSYKMGMNTNTSTSLTQLLWRPHELTHVMVSAQSLVI